MEIIISMGGWRVEFQATVRGTYKVQGPEEIRKFLEEVMVEVHSNTDVRIQIHGEV